MDTETNLKITNSSLLKKNEDLAENAIADISDQDLHYCPNEVFNSIAVLFKHISGNMQSRFSDFLISDGEKSLRDRNAEFENAKESKAELLKKWDQAWNILNQTIEQLKPEDFIKIVTVNQNQMTVTEAILNQLTHYASHIGQIIYIAKMIRNDKWKYLSIPPQK